MDPTVEVLELAEAEAMFDYVQSTSAAVAESLGTAGLRVGGGVAMSVRNDVTHFFSKALGFGFGEPVTPELIAVLTEFYRAQGTPQATIQVAPQVLPSGWADIAEKEGLAEGGTFLKLARTPGRLETAPTDLRIATVQPAEREEWADVLMRGFGMPDQRLAPMAAGVLDRPGWTAYGAWDCDKLVAAASVNIRGEVAEFTGAATLPEYRRRGAQSALLAARTRQAETAGVKWLVVETWKPAPGEKNPSLDNLLKSGFGIRYERPNWIWRP
ncbi:MAG TPA: GNAT family N-acetyltransferase [Kribbella sp.]|nr:GNAT family N-acetyltransferase [Kribbella sp.]